MRSPALAALLLVGLGSAFVLDATVNPDFSEVESDSPQVTVNERFEVLFPERRTFFVENAGYFATPVPTFFSRRILDPGGGARLTGKAGSWLAAGLVMNDRETPDTDAATALVGTVRREFGARRRTGHDARRRRRRPRQSCRVGGRALDDRRHVGGRRPIGAKRRDAPWGPHQRDGHAGSDRA